MKDELRELLAELEAAIERTRESGVEDAELASLVDRVSGRLHDDGEDDEGLVEHLEQAAVRFEADHPNAAAAIRKAVDVLSGYGL